jgi:hypothetical protein
MEEFKYFELTRESEPSVVGVRHGAGQAFLNEEFINRHPHFKEVFYRNDSWTQDWWKRWATWREYGESLAEIPMEKLAKYTDFISTPRLMRGFFLNERLRRVLEEAHLPSHQYFPITFKQGSKIIEGYWWFCFDMETGKYTVDFDKSEFAVEQHQQKYGKLYQINSYEDYLNAFYETGSAIKATTLVLNSNFDQELDIWGTQFLTSANYISKRLLDQWKKDGIKGFRAEYSIWHLVFE